METIDFTSTQGLEETSRERIPFCVLSNQRLQHVRNLATECIDQSVDLMAKRTATNVAWIMLSVIIRIWRRWRMEHVWQLARNLATGCINQSVDLMAKRTATNVAWIMLSVTMKLSKKWKTELVRKRCHLWWRHFSSAIPALRSILQLVGLIRNCNAPWKTNQKPLAHSHWKIKDTFVLMEERQIMSNVAITWHVTRKDRLKEWVWT